MSCLKSYAYGWVQGSEGLSFPHCNCANGNEAITDQSSSHQLLFLFLNTLTVWVNPHFIILTYLNRAVGCGGARHLRIRRLMVAEIEFQWTATSKAGCVMSSVKSGFSYLMNKTILHDEMLSFSWWNTVLLPLSHMVMAFRNFFSPLEQMTWTSLNPRACWINLEVMEEYDLFFSFLFSLSQRIQSQF